MTVTKKDLFLPEKFRLYRMAHSLPPIKVDLLRRCVPQFSKLTQRI